MDAEYPWHSIHFRTPRRMRSETCVRRPRSHAPASAWFIPSADSAQQCSSTGDDGVQHTQAEQERCHIRETISQGDHMFRDAGARTGAHGQQMSMDGLPFSKHELMRLLAEFLSRHSITHQQMTRQHVALFKAFVQHVGSERLELCQAQNIVVPGGECGIAVHADQLHGMHGSTPKQNLQ